jgi:UDP-glucose 4-epimerase
MKILVTGAAGFIAGYLIPELLEAGHQVVGLDNLSKYGDIAKSYQGHSRYEFVNGDAKNTELLSSLLADCDHFVAGAAMIGGISYFHAFAYDLLAENERITAAAFDAAIQAFQKGHLKKVTVISSSMVFESTSEYPTPEGAERRSPPSINTACPTRLPAPLIALVLASAARCATPTFPAEISSWRCRTSCRTS